MKKLLAICLIVALFAMESEATFGPFKKMWPFNKLGGKGNGGGGIMSSMYKRFGINGGGRIGGMSMGGGVGPGGMGGGMSMGRMGSAGMGAGFRG